MNRQMKAKALRPSPAWRLAACLGALWLLTALAAPAGAAETMGGTIDLIPGPVVDGVAHPGLRIDLKPGWHTYWRYPGDSGVPPDLTSEGSRNVASVTVDYPAPMRFGDSSDQTIAIKARSFCCSTPSSPIPPKPADLTINARLGVCRDICVPVDEALTLRIDPATPASATDATTITAVQAQVPKPVTPGAALSVTGIKRDASAKPEMVTFAVKGPAEQLSDVFVEGPAGWALPLPARVSGDGAGSVLSFALDGLPVGGSG